MTKEKEGGWKNEQQAKLRFPAGERRQRSDVLLYSRRTLLEKAQHNLHEWGKREDLSV